MNTEQQVRHTIGDLVINNIILSNRVAELEKQLEELTKKDN